MWTALALLLLTALVFLHRHCRGRLRQHEEAYRQLETEYGRLEARQNDQIERMQARQQALFDNMVEGVLWLDSHRRIQLINHSLAKLLGIHYEVRGRSILEMARLPRLTELIDRLEREERIEAYELELPGLQERFLEVNAARIPGGLHPSPGMVLVFHDLTRIKQLERTRQQFVANVSHELRTPLSMIQGSIETLQDGAKDAPHTADRFLQIMARHTARLTSLIEDLLTLSRLDSGQTRLELQNVALKPLVDRVFDELSERAGHTNITLDNALPEDVTLSIDPNRMHQVFVNLLDNAVKYGRRGGHVRIRLESSEPTHLTIAVEDDGPGIPPEAQQRIFERFYRVDPARSGHEGTGLGLSIVKHLVQLHGGEVWVTSRQGRGTTFFLKLPLFSETAPQTSEETTRRH